MKYDLNTIDILDLVMEDNTNDSIITKSKMSPDDALIKCLNTLGHVDIEYISDITGLSVDYIISTLKGAIYQQPDALEGYRQYNNSVGWVVSSVYLNGNIRKKLEAAKSANKRFCGKFEDNITALKKCLPLHVDIEEIHLSLGATWIPAHEYATFIKDLLKLNDEPEVLFYQDLLTWKLIAPPDAANSVLNTIKYGVRGDTSNSDWTRQYYTAFEITESTMNAKTLKAYDYCPRRTGRSNYEYEPVFNKNKTTEALERQKEIIDAFKDWVFSDSRRISRIEDYYNEAFVGYTNTVYDGSFLTFPDLNPDVTFYKHQRDVIARILLSRGNLLIAHDVGTGKTYEMIASVRELYRLGLSDKNLVVVPNNVLKATVDAHKYLYKNDNILAVFPKDFTPSKRNQTLEKIKNGDYVAVYMAYSSFDMIVMSKAYYVDKMSNRIMELKAAMYNTKIKYERKALKSKIEKLSAKLQKYIQEEQECPWMTFDELGIKTLVVDEAHNYKNIPIQTKASGIVGMGGVGSKKCREMLEKAHSVEQLIFATGTPLTNSLADLYVFQTYLQPEVLNYHNIGSFDTWVNTFGQRDTTIECDVDANSNSLRTMTRFSSFHNLGELMSLFSQVCDFHYASESEEGFPIFNGYINIRVPKNPVQHDYILNLSERTEMIRNKEVRRDEDNLLKVTVDGRKAALDIRLVETDSAIFETTSSKISECANQVLKIYHSTNSVQIVFSDIGVPKDKFNVYDELKSVLIKRGVKWNEISFVHDATSEATRAELFRKMNKGVIRIVIGSTKKLGVGVNVQEKLVAIHHLDVPWRPADMIQREGRILRKGNTSGEVFIYRYITEGSFDAYSWQLLENKQRFIASFLSGTSIIREIADIADTVLTYAEVKALAIGNPLIKKRVEVANELEKTKIASRARQKQMQELKTVIESSPKKIKQFERLAQIARRDFENYSKAKESIPKDERLAFGEELLEALNGNILSTTEHIFDTYQGFKIILPANMMADKRYVIIRSEAGGNYICEMDNDKTFLGCSKSIDYLLDHLEEHAEKLQNQADQAKKQLGLAQYELEKDNPYLEKIERIKTELVRIDEELEASAKKEDKNS